ncbi:ATP-binding protein [Dehalococcoidia bacterium]|nr:ATP-binding protein [Dehalococcoidia bacterium]
MVNKKALVKNSIGIFKGFTESGREFLAEIVMPYQPEFVLLLGSFVLVAVTDNEALLGRITQFYPMGTMAGAEADEYLSQLQRLDRPVPEDVKELKLRYNVKIRLLGTIELVDNEFRYRPGVRALPHLGAAVSLPTDDALQFICNARLEDEPDAVPIGHYALGDREFPNLEVKFSFSRLLSRRTLVFARAGYGKSNLIKLLVSKLYEEKPRVGMLIFDPEGEYSFRDAQGRPGLADLPGVAERLVVFTDRRPPEEKHKRFIAGSVALNLRGIAASHVVEICLPEDRLERVWATRLMGFNQQEWLETVDTLKQSGYRADSQNLGQRLNIDGAAVVRNITPVIRRLHDSTSDLPHSLIYHLARGHVVVVDISLLSSGAGQQVAGLILKTVFDHNVEHFTADEQDAVIPVVAVIEEAQNVLSAEKMKREDSPFVEWVKEGRKYNLGAIIVTQQPGAISDQLLSQGDNFFALHLISSTDLDALKRNNAHFSDDILSYILNEPIEGNAYFWSAPSQPYVISSKLLSFEKYVDEEKAKQAATGMLQQVGLAVQTYQRLSEEIPQLITDIIASERRVPVYTPERNGTILSGYGAIGQANLRLQMAERFFETHKELKPWMLPQFFEVWDDGKPALKQQWVLELGKPTEAIKDGRKGDYVLVELSQISFQGKALDNRRVTLVLQEEQLQPRQQSSPRRGQGGRRQTTQGMLLEGEPEF